MYRRSTSGSPLTGSRAAPSHVQNPNYRRRDPRRRSRGTVDSFAVQFLYVFIYTERVAELNQGGVMDELLERLAEQVELLGLEARVEPGEPTWSGVRAGTAVVSRGRSRQTYVLTYGDKVPLAPAVRRHSDHPTLVFARHIGPKTADAYRRAGIQYVDAAGNASLRFGDVLIDIQGRRGQSRQPRPRVSGNLFTTGRAKVALALLAWPELWSAPQRELAKAARVSLGQVNNALTLLADAGHRPGHGHGHGHHDDADLLRLWAAAFPTGLAPHLTLATFRGKIGALKPAAHETLYVSGETAADDLLRPATATLDVDDLDPRLPVANRWRSDGEPNITVRRTFWRAPSEADGREGKRLIAPWPLVYADLLASDDPRVRGVADEWRAQHA